MCLFCEQGLFRSREGSGDLLSRLAGTVVGESLRTRGKPGLPPRMRPQDGHGSRLALVDVVPRRLRGCCCRCCCVRTALGDVCCRRGCGGEDERCRRCIRGQWTTRVGRCFLWTHVAAERRLGMLFVDKVALGEGQTRPLTVAWAVASMDDVTVPTAVEDVAHVNIC